MNGARSTFAVLVALLVPGGLFVAACLYLRRFALERQKEERADLVTRWRAFIERPAPDGEPTIQPAAVPPVRPLKARRRTPFELLVSDRSRWRA
jgi:hypothetical protein